MADQTALRRILFVDRDGTLIEEVNYLSRVEDLRLDARVACFAT